MFESIQTKDWGMEGEHYGKEAVAHEMRHSSCANKSRALICQMIWVYSNHFIQGGNNYGSTAQFTGNEL